MSLDPANEREADDDGDLLIGKVHPPVDVDEEQRARVALGNEERDEEDLDEEELDEEDLADDGDLDFEPDDAR
jgi:hypothetical protein